MTEETKTQSGETLENPTNQEEIEQPVNEEVDDQPEEEDDEAIEESGEEEPSDEETDVESESEEDKKEKEVLGEKDLEDKRFKFKNKKGEEFDISFKELRDGFFMRKDYSEKNAEVARAREEAVEMKSLFLEGLNGVSNAYADLVNTAQSADDAFSKQERTISEELKNVDWQNLSDADMNYYIRRKHELESVKQKREETQKEFKQRQEKAERQFAEAYRTLKEQETKQLESKIPEFSDEEKGEKLRSALRNYVLKEYKDDAAQVLDSLVDHRHVMMVYKAYKYDMLTSKKAKPKKVVKTLKVNKEGGAEKRIVNENDRTRQLYKKAAKTGRRSDTMAYLMTKV
jgi:hypothetical protein